MSESLPTTDEQTETRQQWESLTFEKIALADAQAGLSGTGVDNSFYS